MIDSCVLDGVFYPVDQPVPSSDCNSCVCTEGGNITCTTMECPGMILNTDWYNTQY